DYQIYNASLAITVLMVLRDKGLIKISNEEISKGISKTKWKGRLEILRRSPDFLIDGAHNTQGARHLKKALELFDYDNLILGIGILEDKDVDHILEVLVPMADKVITTEVDMPRKLDGRRDRKSTRLNSSHVSISYAVFCLKKKKTKKRKQRQ